MNNNDNLKSFISKLNDRNLQRKRESGVTTYVLYTLLFFCVYKLYKNISYSSLNLENFEISEFVHLTCYISNSLVGLYFIILTFQTEKTTFSNLKVIKYDINNFNLFRFIIAFFLFSIPIISLILSFCYNIDKIVDFNLFFYVFFGILNIILLFFLYDSIFRSKKNIEISNGTKEYIGLKIIIIIISITVIIICAFLSFKISINDKFILTKIIFLIYANLFILEKIVEQEMNDITTFKLENFEYEIYLKNLSDDEIRKRLQENYIGYLIDYWIEYKNKELNLFIEEIDTRILDINSKIIILETEVNKKKYPIEYEGRKKTIYSNLEIELKFKLPKFIKTQEEVAKILNDKNNLTDIEINDLTLFQNRLKNKLNEYQKFIKN